MDFKKGDFVVSKKEGSAQYYQGYGRVYYENDSEFMVTSVRSGGQLLNVRMSDGQGRVFVVEASAVYKPTRRLGEVPEGGISPEDPRVSWIFDDAGRLASRLGYCNVYDKITDALGAPGRLRKFKIKIGSQNGIELTATVEAKSKSLAEKALRASVPIDGPLQIEATK